MCFHLLKMALENQKAQMKWMINEGSQSLLKGIYDGKNTEWANVMLNLCESIIPQGELN